MTGGDANQRPHTYTTELVGLASDVILAVGGSTLGPVLRATRSVPIVFVSVKMAKTQGRH
jgi:hypothetical protein